MNYRINDDLHTGFLISKCYNINWYQLKPFTFQTRILQPSVTSIWCLSLFLAGSFYSASGQPLGSLWTASGQSPGSLWVITLFSLQLYNRYFTSIPSIEKNASQETQKAKQKCSFWFIYQLLQIQVCIRIPWN